MSSMRFLLKPLGNRSSCLFALLSGCLFFVLTVAKLGVPDLPYDEIPTAPAAFLLLGKAPYEPHTVLQWGQIPLLTVTYIGALKSGIFGLLMKLGWVTFNAVTWRLVGISFVAAGMLLFFLSVARHIPLIASVAFLWFFLTDCTILCYTRVDWGPMALSLLCRLVWIGVWLKFAVSRKINRLELFLLGFAPAFLVYEKLNNVVFLLPFLILLITSRELRSWSRLQYIAVGILIGSIPFVVTNIVGQGISFLQIGSTRAIPVIPRMPFIQFLKLFVGMGVGQEAKNIVLGTLPSPTIKYIEVLILHSLLLVSSLVALKNRTRSRYAPVVLFSAVSYYLLALATWALPGATAIHHWIVSAPFQYVAVAFAICMFLEEPLLPATSYRRGAIVILVGCLAFNRGANLWDTERHFLAGKASDNWRSDYSKIAKFVALHARDANFIAADYGFGAQVYCFSNGDCRIAEPFWNYQGPAQLQSLLASQQPGRPVYVITSTFPSVIANKKETVLNDLHRVLGKAPLAVEPEVANLYGIKVEKFAYPEKPPVDGRL